MADVVSCQLAVGLAVGTEVVSGPLVVHELVPSPVPKLNEVHKMHNVIQEIFRGSRCAVIL
jgi:hypothetical protein